MSLLDQNEKKQEPKGKKIVLALLILSVILLVFAVIAIIGLKDKKESSPLTISINEENIEVESDLLLVTEDELDYISIQKISKAIGYNYLTGEYKKYDEDDTNTKGYLENENQVIQFEADSNIIYKIDLTTDLDYEEYKLDNKILRKNNLLYISFKDLRVGLNVIYSYSQDENKISLDTVQKIAYDYETILSEDVDNSYNTTSDDLNNNKAIAYDMLVVSNENQKLGVINTKDYTTIVGNKYSSMEFVEPGKSFIVSDNNKYGIISCNPNQKLILDLKYEEISVVCNNPLCYKIKIKDKYALINEEGNLIINDTFNSFGYNSRTTGEESVLVANNIGKDKHKAIVICKDDKYGLLDLDNGKIICDCVLEKIYSKYENEKVDYYVQLNEQEIQLDKYIEQISITTINIGN